jgi:diguanylate cyclase (GGDEF)-like protein
MLRPEIRSLLADSVLLRDVDIETVEPLIGQCGRMNLARGEVLLEPGTPNSWLYVILSGQLRVYPGGRDLPAQAVLGPGECVGEISLVDGRGASALVIASEPAEVFIIDHDILWSMIELSSAIARNLLITLAGRMRRGNSALVHSQSHNIEFERVSAIDPVTGVHTRQWMLETFPRVVQRSVLDKAPLCLCLLDLDGLAGFNERRGHLMGDTLLRAVCERALETLRVHDLMARADSRAFAVLLPNADLTTGTQVAERLRQVIAATRLPVGDDGSDDGVTVSGGVAPIHPGETLETLLGAAEHALLRAKAQGRNRIEAAG